MISRIISQDILFFLHKTKKCSVKEISQILSISIGQTKLILNGASSLSPDEIKKIIKHFDYKVIQLLSLSCPLSHLSNKLKDNVILYKKLSSIKKNNKT